MAKAKRIGILGAGQLGRMLALAGYPMGLEFHFFDPAPEAPAARLGPWTQAAYDDWAALERFLAEVDVLSYEFENVAAASAEFVAVRKPLYPGLKALAITQDRLAEKQLLRGLGVPTVDFAVVDTREDLIAGLAQLGFPAVLKTRRLGYDGKGQYLLKDRQQAELAWQDSCQGDMILEAFCPFEQEFSLISVRGLNGEMRHYPLIENQHRSGVLRLSRCPAPQAAAALELKAQRYAEALLQAWDYVGVMTLEFFCAQGRLIANEIAPRVHNSGHLTIEAAATSQFENHLRAILGWPLGATSLRGHAAMLNLLGELPAPVPLLAIPELHWHDYGKGPKPGRKLGHVTLLAESAAVLEERLEQTGKYI